MSENHSLENPTFITGINHITLAVSDLENSFRFYKDVLCFKPLCKWPKGAYFLAGNLWFCLYKDEKRSNIPSPCYTHIAFDIANKDFDTLYARLNDAKIKFWKDNISEGDSLYLLDPDGHKLEIHVGNWFTRLQHKKANPWEDAEFFV